MHDNQALTRHLNEQRSQAEGDEGCDPGKEDCVDGRDDGPFPASAFVLDGDKCGYAWEVEQDEDHVCQCGGRGNRADKGTLEAGFA